MIANAPEGLDALLLAGLAAELAPVALLHVARDDARMARIEATLGFFAPETEVLTFPAWDCLPYDRVGPHRDILARRIDTLSRLAEDGSRLAEDVWAAVVAVMVVSLTTVTPVAADPPKVTVAPLAKSVPVMVTTVPPAVGPLVGSTEVTVGTGPMYV